MKGLKNAENAAVRDNFVSEIYDLGVSVRKKSALSELPARLADMHRSGAVHIHDLESGGEVYNCCTPAWGKLLSTHDYGSVSSSGAVFEIFAVCKQVITELAVSQTGGIGFANFDIDVSAELERLHVAPGASAEMVVGDAIRDLLVWTNRTRTRYNREPYYLSLNVGLGTGVWARTITRLLMEKSMRLPADHIRPNIIFKVKEGVSWGEGSPNADLLDLALKCTAERMRPTYLLLDSKCNADCDPTMLGIMGCRTRVYQNINGKVGTIGRGNISCVSINLPRIALMHNDATSFFLHLENTMYACAEILKIRIRSFLASDKLDDVIRNRYWEDVGTQRDMVRQGSCSIGFIGLAEAVEVLTGKKMYADGARDLAYQIIVNMRKTVDRLRATESLNYALLASPGEMISGRFAEIDAKLYRHRVQEKGFYTNSFHSEVDAGMGVCAKLMFEGRFHELCNGGSISYVELAEAPLSNVLGLHDILEVAIRYGVSYLGINYPLDVCRRCNHKGTFDVCPVCGSEDIKRIRRVSGYLEDIDHFTRGKTREVQIRTANARCGRNTLNNNGEENAYLN